MRTLGTCELCRRRREWYAALDGWWCGSTDWRGNYPYTHPTFRAPSPVELAKMTPEQRQQVKAAAKHQDDWHPTGNDIQRFFGGKL